MNLFLLLLKFPIDCWCVPIIVQTSTIDPPPFLRTSQAKESLGLYVFHDEASKPPSTQTQLGASLIAGFTATACSLPFDLLKSRMRKFYLVHKERKYFCPFWCHADQLSLRQFLSTF